jgi:hypothetical protein
MAPIADVSALGGFPANQMKMSNSIYEQHAAATATTIWTTLLHC